MTRRMIELRVLGSLELRDERGGEVRRVLAQPKRLALLVYLAVSRATHRRDALRALFWPEHDEPRARLALRQAVHFLRAALGPDAVRGRTSEELAVDDARLRCDAVEFERALDAGRAADALLLYRGDLLPGFHPDDVSAELEHWLDHERLRLRARAARAAWSLAEEAEARGDGEEAAHRARQAVHLAPDDEAGFRRLAALLDRLGDRRGVLRAYDEFARRLQAEFDVAPAAETRALIEAVRARETVATALPATAPTATPATVMPAPALPIVAPRTGVPPVRTARRSWRAAAAVAGGALVLAALGATAATTLVRRVAAEAAERTASRVAAATPASGAVVARHLHEEGLRAYYRGDGRAALRLFLAALKVDSTLAMAAYHASITAAVPPDSSRALLARAMRLAGRAPERERLIVRLQWFASEPEAAALADSLVTRHPQEPDGHLALGTVRVAAGDFLAAVAPLRRVIAMDSAGLRAPRCRTCDAYTMIVAAYVSLDSLAAAERTLLEWARRQPSAAPPWLQLATVRSLAGDRAGALAARRRGDALEPGLGDALDAFTHARFALAFDDFAEADALLTTRLRYDERDVDALWLLAISQRNQGRLTDALATADRAVRSAPPPTRATTLLGRAQVLFDAGRYREAAAAFESLGSAMAARGGAMPGTEARRRVWPLAHAASAWAAAGDTVRVARLAAEIAALAPRSAYGRDRRLPDHVRGLLWQARGRPDSAAAAFRRAIFSRSVGYTRTNLELARVTLALGRADDATDLLRGALRGYADGSNLYVTRTELHELLARAHDMAGRRDSAAAHYRLVARAWSAGDPPFRARARAAEHRARALDARWSSARRSGKFAG